MTGHHNQNGGIVNITIRGVTFMSQDASGVTIADEHGNQYPMPPQAEIEHIAPATWPPKPGDLWRDRHGHLHFGADYSPDYDDMDDRRGIGADGTRVVLLSQNADESCHPGADWHRPENVLQQLGPLTLVYRDEQQDGGPMTGPEHYKAGERYLTHAKNEIQISSSRAAALAQIAAAHFAAAQAAVLGDVGDDMDGPDIAATPWPGESKEQDR